MPYEIGDTEPPHIDIHNELNAQVAELSTRTGIPVELPPIVSLGDTGHVNDHNLYTTAIQKIADGVVPGVQPAPIVTPPSSLDGPDVVSYVVKDAQGVRKTAYLLPGNTGPGELSLALTEEGAEALAARRELLDAIATTDVPEEFEGDPVTLLPKKLRGELTGFVEVRANPQASATYSVTLGAGVFPGVMVGAGGQGGLSWQAPYPAGGGGASGVIGAGCHVPVILPVQGTATYTITVGSTTVGIPQGQPTTLAVQNQIAFAAAVGGGRGLYYASSYAVGARSGGSGGGTAGYTGGEVYLDLGEGIPGQGNRGGVSNGAAYSPCGGGGGYGSDGGSNGDGGAGFDLATALNLDANDGLTSSLLNLVSVDGFIAGGGSGGGTATAGGGQPSKSAMDYTGAGGGGDTGTAAPGGSGAAGMVLLITDPPQ